MKFRAVVEFEVAARRPSEVPPNDEIAEMIRQEVAAIPGGLHEHEYLSELIRESVRVEVRRAHRPRKPKENRR